MLTVKMGAVAAVMLALAACGTTTEDRAASGAGIGAGTGAAIGALFGGVGAIPGALVGAAIGGGTGAVTDESKVNLGQPVWRDDDPVRVGS
jgi:hypothetical protein